MRSPSDRPSPAGRASWKQRGGTPRARQSSGKVSGGGKTVARWLLTLLLLGLLAGFGFSVWARQRGERFLTASTVWATDPLTIPPLAFAREDLDALTNTPDVQFFDASSDGQDAANLLAMVERAARRPQSPKDVLILFLSAYGFPDDSGPFLAGSDFRRSATGGRVPVRDLLDKLAASKAGTKVLILDAARLDLDPRLGLFGNDFAAQVANEVQRHSGRDLWLLLSGGPGQNTALTPGAKRSVFGTAIAEGLAGAATNAEQGGDGDQFVDLGELTNFAQRACLTWSGAELPDFQVPLLLRTGLGIVPAEQWPTGKPHRLLYVEATDPADAPAEQPPAPPDAEKPGPTPANSPAKSGDTNGRTSRLPLPIDRRSIQFALFQNGAPAGNSPNGSPAAPPAVAPPQSPAPSPTEPSTPPPATTPGPAGSVPASPPASAPSAPGTATPAPTTPNTPATSPTAPPVAPPTDAQLTLTPRDKERAELLRLWNLRDQLLRRPSDLAVTPLDFAPHLWRELEAWLLYFEQRFLFGRIGDSQQPGDTREVQESDLRLRDMRSLANDLEQLAAAMRGEPAGGSPDEKSIGDRLLRAWQRYTTEQLPRDRQLEREADPLLREARTASRVLREQAFQSVYFVRWHGQSTAQGIGTAAQRGAIVAHLAEIAGAIRELQRLEKSAIPSSSTGALRQWVQRQTMRTEQRRELEEELASVEQEALRAAGQPVAIVRTATLLATPLLPAARRAALWDRWSAKTAALPVKKDLQVPSVATSVRWVSVRRDTLQLEAKLLALVNEEIAKRIEVLAQPASPGESAEAEQKRLRDAAREAFAFADGLPQALVHEWSVLLLDPRDVPQLDAGRVPLPTFRLELQTDARLEVIPMAKQVRLAPGKETRLSLVLRATRENLLDARIAPTNADGLVGLELLPDEEQLPIDRGWYSKRVHYRVTVQGDALGSSKSSTQVSIGVTAGTLSAQSSVEVLLPRPDQVDIFLSRLGSHESPPGEQVRLELFANRNTRFQCELVNRFDEPRTVTVTLYAVAPRPTSQVPVGQFDAAIKRVVYDAAARVFLDAKPVAKSEKPVELPAASAETSLEKRVTFNWMNPNVPATPVAPTAPAAGTAPAPPASPPASEPIHGLVLEVVDVKDASKQWISWIELEPLSPREYLDVSVGYQQRTRQIVATVRPKLSDPAGHPILPPGKPVWIEWDPSEAKLPSEGKKNLAGELDPAADTPQAVLTAEAEPDGQERVVKLAVDGYPRAFLYRVPCRRDPTAPEVIAGRDLERETTSIKIESVTVPAQKRVYHFLPDFQAPPPPDDKPPVVEHIGLAPREAALFLAKADALVVRLQADAPIDAFRPGSSDRVQVVLRENSFTRVIRSDRRFQAMFVSSGPRGIFELGSAVDDLELTLSPADLQNVQSAIDADIRFGEQSDTDTVLVNLDGDFPRIESVSLPGTAPKDGMLTLRFVVTDYHGVARVTYGFSKDGSPKLADADALSQVVTTRQDEQRRHVFDLPLDLKDIPAGRRLFLAKVQDHVGHESKFFSRELIIVPPTPMPTTGEIRGVLRYGPAKVNGSAFKMTIEGGELGPTPVDITPDGAFLIPDLPIAEYTLKVLEGSFSGKSVPPKEQKGVKPTDPKKAQTIVIDVR